VIDSDIMIFKEALSQYLEFIITDTKHSNYSSHIKVILNEPYHVPTYMVDIIQCVLVMKVRFQSSKS